MIVMLLYMPQSTSVSRLLANGINSTEGQIIIVVDGLRGKREVFLGRPPPQS
jgi:hypothetical protein